jgi:sec-independent protein translocase protein TatB
MGISPHIAMGNLGMADSLILMVLALVVFGPRRLPQIGRQIGKLMYEFRKASNDFKFQMEEELRLSEEADRRKKEEEQRKQVAQESVSATPVVAKGIESTSSGEATQPPQKMETDEPRPDDEMPRILPPSTGETVAARTTGETSGEPVSEEPAANTDSTEQTAAEGQASGPVAEKQDASPTEAVSHHG